MKEIKWLISFSWNLIGCDTIFGNTWKLIWYSTWWNNEIVSAKLGDYTNQNFVLPIFVFAFTITALRILCKSTCDLFHMIDMYVSQVFRTQNICHKSLILSNPREIPELWLLSVDLLVWFSDTAHDRASGRPAEKGIYAATGMKVQKSVRLHFIQLVSVCILVFWLPVYVFAYLCCSYNF